LSRDLRIAVVDKNPLRASILEEGLDLESPSRDVLEQMFKVSRSVARPVAMFVDRSDAETIDAAIDAGVSTYIVDGLHKDRVKPILDMTISCFSAFAKLKRELETAKSQLDDRKVIDRAKALVMRAKAIPEEQAYALMRHVAMNENKKIAEVARSIITAAELLR
jgi:two-component system, response regulator / RNA-binding antiterminator